MITFEEDIKRALEVLNNGGIIVYPTDTIWGVGCDATNEAAVEELVKLKGRDPHKGIISLASSKEMVEAFTSLTPPANAQETPLTVIYPQAHGLAPAMLSDIGTAAIRITSEIYSRTLCQLLGKPIASSSANFSGEKAPKVFGEIDPQFLERADYIACHGRDYKSSKPSKIIKINNDNTITVIRP